MKYAFVASIISFYFLCCTNTPNVEETSAHNDSLKKGNLISEKNNEKDSMELVLENSRSNSKDVSYFIYSYFKNNPSLFSMKIKFIETKLKERSLDCSEIICDEVINDNYSTDKSKAILLADSLFSKFDKIKIRNKQSDSTIEILKQKVLLCIKESGSEGDPSLIKY